jgi:hypothetical protein
MFKKEEAYQHALCMDLTPDKFQFSIVHSKEKKIVHSEILEITDFDKDSLKKLLQNDWFTHDYGSFSISSGGNRNTLIPVDLFNYSKPAEIFRLNYPAPIDNLDYNRIPELGIVNIYEIPLWVKSAFVIRFPRVKVIHRSTVLLKGIFDHPTYSPKIHLFVENDQFYFVITEKSKLVYYNRFDYKELSDLVYYVLFVMEQKELDQSKFEINLYGLASNWEEKEKLQSFFESKVKIADKNEVGKDFMLAKQLLCV